MSKDKRKRKYFQGMEHLQYQMQGSQSPTFSSMIPNSLHISSNTTTQDEFLSAHKVIRNDLIKVLLLLLGIIIIISGLAILNVKTTYISKIAHNLTSYVIPGE